MKFAFYGDETADAVRRCRITTRWVSDPNDMADLIDRSACDCRGCYLDIHTVLAQVVKEAEERPLRAVIIVGDAFHDTEDDLAEAAICANQLHRAGTRVFLLQVGDDPDATTRLRYLARVAGSTYFRFNPKTQERQFAEMWEAVSAYAAGGEEGVKKAGGQAATLLLQHLKQVPLPNIEEPIRVGSKSPVHRKK
jgi:hypothetical protein